MASRFFSWILNKLRFRRFALSRGVKQLEQYGFYAGSYSNWKHDPTPLVFIMYSGPKHTHAINTHYLSRGDKEWLGRMLYLLKKGNQIIDGYALYRLFKLRRMSIVKTAYRIYFTSLLNMKLVGAGLTNLDRLVYPITKDPWLLALNEMMKPEEIGYGAPEVAFSPTELQERVNQAINAVPIQQQTIRKPAPYARPAPYIRP